MSNTHTSLIDIIAAGSTDSRTGRKFGGVYYPEHQKNGKTISGKWQGRFFVNNGSYTDRTTGQKVELKSDIITLVGWNGRNSRPGSGLADILAKSICPGKRISCFARITTFEKAVFRDGQQVMLGNGQPLMVEAVAFEIIPGNKGISFGPDPAKVLNHEIAMRVRPAGWHDPASPDYRTWGELFAQRLALTYTGGPVYGYARVIIPNGAQMMNGLNVGMPSTSWFDGLAPVAPAQAQAPASMAPPVYNAPAPTGTFNQIGTPAQVAPAQGTMRC